MKQRLIFATGNEHKMKEIREILDESKYEIISMKEAGVDIDIVEDGNFKNIRITLKYGADKNEKIITGLKRISKPGLRVYAGKDELPKVLGGLGIAIISTSKGVMTDKAARKAGLGGEVLAFVW